MMPAEMCLEVAKKRLLEILEEGPYFREHMFVILEYEDFKEWIILRAIAELRESRLIEYPRKGRRRVIKLKIKPKGSKMTLF